MNRPRFSIIVVAYNIENFIEQGMLSCVFRDRQDYEVIIVENKSTDRTLMFAERIANEYPGIFKIIECDKNHGLGIGRNIGIDNSSGDYILFLDGDDWFADGALDRLASLVEQNKSDIFVFNHARAYDDGSISPNILTKLLSEGYRDTPKERGNILQNFGVAWNKMYKRSFVELNGLRFGEGFYEDVDWNFEALLTAGNVYALPDILIFYRQRIGSITRSTDVRHLDILQQYTKVIRFLKKRPDFVEAYGKIIYFYARNQMTNVLNDKGRLPPKDRPRFLRDLATVLADFRSLVGRKRLTWKETAVNSGNIFLYDLLIASIGRLEAAGKTLKRRYGIQQFSKLQKRWLAKYRLAVYRRQTKKLPLRDNLVFLESFWGRKIDCNPAAIAQALERNGFECIWSLQNGGAMQPHYTAATVMKGSAEYYRILAQAKYLVSNANITDDWIKRNGQVHLQTFHGTPLKFMGLDIIKTNPREMSWAAYARRSKRWDYAISSNPFSTRVWRQNSPYGYKIIEAGYPRNDILSSQDPALVDRIRRDIGIPEGKKIVLYAPTFRDAEKNKTTNTLKTKHFDAEIIQKAFGSEYVILTRGHYFVKSSPDGQSDKIFDVSSHVSSNEICLISDILITDYSSIMFDFACLGRPIILYTYDYDNYAKQRGMYFDIKTEGPGMIVSNSVDLLEGIRNKSYQNDQNAERLKLFRERFCSFDDGQATERVLAEVFGIRPQS